MGLVTEEYITESSFGTPLAKSGAYYAAAIAMEYDINAEAMLRAEGLHSEDEVHQHKENKLQLIFTCHY